MRRHKICPFLYKRVSDVTAHQSRTSVPIKPCTLRPRNVRLYLLENSLKIHLICSIIFGIHNSEEVSRKCSQNCQPYYVVKVTAVAN